MGSSSQAVKITDLNDDVFAHCARYLSVRDISNMAIASKSLKHATYSDSVWTHYFRERWPNETILGSLGMRETFVAQQVDLLKFKFRDPLTVEIYEDAGFEQILLDRDIVYLSQRSRIWKTQIHNLPNGEGYYSYANLSDHKARITCMRSFPLPQTSFLRSESKRDDNMLLTSSSDHTIRLWWKASCQRCFKGHNGPVTTLSDKLLGDGNVFASGGEDMTVRLWSLTASGKRREPSLQATLCGHTKPIKFLSVAGHKTTLLASISNDSKVRVWDAASASASSSGRSFCCVGMTSVQGPVVSIKCDESLLYIAAGSSVVSIDLRTMQKASIFAVSQRKINSFAMLPSESLICTGGDGKAMLWDIRKGSSQAVAEMVGHKGRITQLHMDRYKIVTGGPQDVNVNVWETNTGEKANSFECCDEARINYTTLSAMAVQGMKIVTCGGSRGIYVRDFNKATLPVSKSESSSKFWKSNEESGDSDDSDHGEED